MIVSVCPTTTLERNWVIPKFSLGGFHRVQREYLFASGKGVNVARVIQTLRGQVVCTGFVGGFTGQLFQQLAAREGIPGNWVEACIETRESITVYDPQSTGDATSFCPNGPAVQERDWERLAARVYELTAGAKLISISGNIPPGIRPEEFSTFIAELGSRGSLVWLDLSGPALSAGARATPFAIKVNAKECTELTGQPIHTPAEALKAARDLRAACSTPLIVITLGCQGAVCSSAWGEWIIPPLAYSKVISPIGCGDAFLGGMLTRYDEGADLETCLRSGAAAAGASTQKLGPGNFDLSEYDLAFQRTILERVA